MCVGVGGYVYVCRCMCVGVMVYICTCLCIRVHPCVGPEVKARGLYHFLLFSLEMGSLAKAGGHCFGTPGGHLPVPAPV